MRRPGRWGALAIVGLLGAILLVDPPGRTSPETARAYADTIPADRSALPCQAVLGWRVGHVDPWWGMEPEEVAAEAGRAARVWEEAAGAPLFRHDPDGGFPIHLEHDERRDRFDERHRMLDSARRALSDSVEALEAARRGLDSQQEELNRRVRRHNERVAALDGRREVTEAELEEIRDSAREIQREQERLEERAAAFEDRRQRFERQQDRVQSAIEAYNQSPGLRTPMTTGKYSERVTLLDGRVASVDDRSITVYSLADRAGLVNVIAHEFGHALGLGHVRDPAAVMAEIREIGAGGDELVIRPADREELRRRCPELVRGR